MFFWFAFGFFMDNYYLCGMKAKGNNAFDRLFEIGVPVFLTVLWCIGLAFIAFDWIKQPSLLYSPPLQTYQIIIDLRITLILFFIELFVYCLDFAYSQRNKNISAPLTFSLIAVVVIALALYLWFENMILFNGATWWLFLMAIICVGVPKFFSCEISRNPGHFTKSRKSRNIEENKTSRSTSTDGLNQVVSLPPDSNK